MGNFQEPLKYFLVFQTRNIELTCEFNSSWSLGPTDILDCSPITCIAPALTSGKALTILLVDFA